MLVLHKSSSCDICMEEYDLESHSKSPYVIPCGHILCLTCINALPSTTCPLCRSDFVAYDLKRLHANASETEAPTAPVDTQAIFLLERIALVFGEDCPQEDVLTVINEVNAWLIEQDADDTFLNIPLRSAFNALCRLKEQDFHGHSELTDELQTARCVEQSLLTQLEIEQEVITTLRHDLESNLEDADITIRTLRLDCNRFKGELEEQKAAIENLRAELRISTHEAAEFRETSRVVEESLLAHIKENEAKYTSELGAAEWEIMSLRSELSRLRNIINTLRPPPPPVPPRPSSHTLNSAPSSAPLIIPDSPVRPDSSSIPPAGSENGHLHLSLNYTSSGHLTCATNGRILPTPNASPSIEIMPGTFSEPETMRVQMSIPRYLADDWEDANGRKGGFNSVKGDDYGYGEGSAIVSLCTPAAGLPLASTNPFHQASAITTETTPEQSGEDPAKNMGEIPRKSIAERIGALRAGLAGLSITATKSPPGSPDDSVSYAVEVVADTLSSRNELDNMSPDTKNRGIVRGWNPWL